MGGMRHSAPWSVVPLPSGTSADPGLSLTQDGALIRRTILPGGIRVLTEDIPSTRSVALGAWVAVGSRDEADEHAGATHFLEHLLFKGTVTRTAYDIAAAFDAVGGEANAATAKNYTCYWARVLDADLPLATEVLLDMVTSSVLDPADVETEREVILEELAMALDDPADLAHERFTETVLAGHPLARPIGGTPESIAALSRDAMVTHYRAHYAPAELVVTAAGNLAHDAVCDAVLAGARTAGWALDDGASPAARRAADSAIYAPATTLAVPRATEQAHLILGGRGTSNADPRRFALAVASTILGGGMSSRLFQEIREKRGLAYNTYSFTAAYAEGGILGTYAACAPGKVTAVLDVLAAEMARLAEEPVSGEELRRAIGQICGNFVLGSEDTGARMTRLGLAEVVTGRLLSVEETLALYRAVTADEVQAVAADLLTGEPTLVVVGPERACAAVEAHWPRPGR